MLKSLRFAVLLAGVTLGFAAMAQPAPEDQGPPPGQGEQSDQADPPTRVARLSYIHGAVSFVPAGENDWVEAQLNRPLVTGDKLWTDNGSRAELEIGSAAMRMDGQTSFDFLNLDDNAAQVELTQGSLNLRVRRLYDGQTYEIDTPTLAFVANRVGEFRIDVQPDGQTTVVSVMHGGGDVYGEGGARFHVDEGQSVTFSDPQLQNYESADLPQADEFDQFALQRDGRWDNSPSKRYVSEDLIGYQDLDDYGSWDDAPEYGHVWYPSHVEADWSPYHSGHWAWVGAYGWTWVDDAPWGFAPFHYGRWAYVGNRWGWCPGEIAVRPVYAPALVAFVGGGVSIGISSGPIGWFPLGYRDPYFPAYHVSQRYFTNVNVYNTRGINVTVINNYYGGYRGGHVDYANIHYANREVRGAVVAVPATAFVSARPVAAARVRVDEHTFANGRVSGFAAVAPTRASVVAASTARAVPVGRAVNRPIVAATRPPAPVAPFAQRQAELTRNPGQPLAVRQLHAAPAAGAAAGGRPVVNNNVKVVTPAGAPTPAAAPVIQRGAKVGNPAVVNRGNGNLPAVQRGAANANNGRPVVNGAPATNTNNGRPIVNGAAANANNGRPVVNGAAANAMGRPTPNNGRPNATETPTATSRPNANSRLDSSRFAHPNGTPGTPANNAAENRTGPVTRQTNESLQNRGNNNAGAANRNNGPQFARPNNGTPAGNAENNGRAMGTTNNNRPVATPTTNAPVRSTTPNNEFHRPPPTETQHVAPQTQSRPQQDFHRAPPTETQHAPPPQTQSRPQQDFRQVQQHQQPTPQVQQQQRVVTPVQQQPRVVAPVQQPPHNNPPPPQNRGNDRGDHKKDDDKKGH